MELRPYQKRIANWLCQHPHACLSVGMGLGKTAAVLHFVDYALKLHPDATALIVAPKRVAETVWMQEAGKWGLERVRSRMILVTAKNKAAAETFINFLCDEEIAQMNFDNTRVRFSASGWDAKPYYVGSTSKPGGWAEYELNSTNFPGYVSGGFSQVVFFSTLLSMVTIPIMTLLF